jgi:hypothetical protein
VDSWQELRLLQLQTVNCHCIMAKGPSRRHLLPSRGMRFDIFFDEHRRVLCVDDFFEMMRW